MLDDNEVKILCDILAAKEEKVRHHQSIRTQTANIYVALIVALLATVGWGAGTSNKMLGEIEVALCYFIIAMSVLGFLTIMLHHRKIKELDYEIVVILNRLNTLLPDTSEGIKLMLGRERVVPDEKKQHCPSFLLFEIICDYLVGLWRGYVSAAQASLFIITAAVGIWMLS